MILQFSSDKIYNQKLNWLTFLGFGTQTCVEFKDVSEVSAIRNTWINPSTFQLNLKHSIVQTFVDWKLLKQRNWKIDTI